jgi:hypothetical protein
VFSRAPAAAQLAGEVIAAGIVIAAIFPHVRCLVEAASPVKEKAACFRIS